ncbi:MAG TPA: response regulator [Chitinophagaceae bacterium]|nr:response regulator [Chitinophagaceae bacterium]
MKNHALDILLVEDNPDDAELTIRSLRKVNMANKLVHVKDGAEALELLFGKEGDAPGTERQLPKVILLDIKMPKVDGIEVLRRIKSAEETRSIPVVIMTSSKEQQDMINSYNLGVNSYVVKPVEFNNFAKAVSDLGMYWLLVNETPY